MASTMASGNRVAWKYTDNNANDWAMSAKAVYVLDGTDGAKYGGSAAARTVKALPVRFRPRRAQLVSAAGDIRWIVAYEEDAAIWTTPGTTLTLNHRGVDTSFESTGTTLGERRSRRGTFESA